MMNDESKNELPKGWVEFKLKNLTSLKGGFAFKSKEYVEKEKGIAILRMGSISKEFKVRWNPKKQVYFPIDRIEEVKSYLLKKEDLLICLTDLSSSGDYLGTVARMDETVALLNQRVSKFVIEDKKIDKNFLYYQLCSPEFRYYMTFDPTGTIQKNTNHKYVLDFIFRYPKKEEQERIVKRLDSIFNKVDTLNEKLAKIPDYIKQSRQAILHQAVTGKLTEDWRKGKGLADWVEYTLKKLTTKIGSGSTPRGGQKSYKTEGIPLVRSMNVHFLGIKYKGLAFIDENQALALKNVTLQKDDLLLNITGASIGRVCLVEESIIGGRVNQHVSILRPNQEKLGSKYLNIYLSSNVIQDYIFKENYGVTRQALTKVQQENLIIQLPKIEEQEEIVKRVESLFSKLDKIEQQYQEVNEKIKNLPQAVLHKAFKGELV